MLHCNAYCWFMYDIFAVGAGASICQFLSFSVDPEPKGLPTPGLVFNYLMALVVRNIVQGLQSGCYQNLFFLINLSHSQKCKPEFFLQRYFPLLQLNRIKTT